MTKVINVKYTGWALALNGLPLTHLDTNLLVLPDRTVVVNCWPEVRITIDRVAFPIWQRSF